jgi:phosphonate transport system substrate-binding protein
MSKNQPVILRCGLLPGESTPVVLQMNEPLRFYLERQLGIKVELVVGKSYASTGEELRRGNLDIAYLGPVTYALQSRHVELEPFARPTHAGSTGPTFKAVVIVPRSSNAETLADLKGKEIALGDLASTSGSWVPRHMLLETGLVADRDYRRRHLGTHDAVAKAVADHKVMAGGLSMGIYNRLLEEKRLDPEAVRVIAESRPIPEYMWTFRAGLDPELREDVRQAFIRLRAPEALRAYRAEAFIPAADADIDRVRYWMEDILQATLADHKSSAEHMFLRKSSSPLTKPKSFQSIVTC